MRSVFISKYSPFCLGHMCSSEALFVSVTCCCDKTPDNGHLREGRAYHSSGYSLSCWGGLWQECEAAAHTEPIGLQPIG